ncbi:MAG: hypothetical protein K6B70_07830 [Clostridia bacterium]|nr:hypothetical protein [Clostridia bacterium]
MDFRTLYKPVIYSSYNSIILIPVLITINKQISNKKDIKIISIISTIFVVILCLATYNILLQGTEEQFKLDIPIVDIVKVYGPVCTKSYLLIIGISIFTTAISSGCSFLNNCNKSNFKRNAKLLSISALFISQIPFGTIVNFLYPVLGIVGLIEIIVIFL